MIGKSTSAYIFIRFIILCLRSVIFISLSYSMWLVFSPCLAVFHPVHVPLPIDIYLRAEAAFLILFFVPYRYFLQHSAYHVKPLPLIERRHLFNCCMSNVTEPEVYLQRWFNNAKREEIKRDNLKDFFRWAFFNDNQTDGQTEEIEIYTAQMEKLLKRELPLGKGSAEHMGRKVSRGHCSHRSILWYLCIFMVDAVTICLMKYNGFHFHRTSRMRIFTLFPPRPFTLLASGRSPATHLTYWFRKHTAKNRLPVLFLHGIGVGLYPYTSFLHELTTHTQHETDDGEIGVIALEIMPVSSRITHPALSKDDMVSEIHSIVEHHRWGRFVLVSHSYGSIIATHIIKSPVTATLAGPLVFIDPICFLLHLPEVTYNFLVRKPVHANEHQLYYFASSDIGVADTLAKHFCWSESILWKKDLMIEEQGIRQSQRDTIVVLSGRDLIVDTQAVRKYLLSSLVSRKMVTNGEKVLIGRPEAPNVQMRAGQWKPPRIEVIWYEMLDHAQVFDNQETRKPIVTAIKKYAAKYRVPRG
ncbi:hypothetical protein BDV23DRAFT_171463 [Aspergillus alliaceus]|uniref:AB hydrolase-1 domain-containing protein n=1 Tax=Petromyces alliaceus TaxID=209559 RepID=A0A5N7CD96_PETAA|nr:hypothetical protein BDV23DRAFT_171463 [Aspergillus alliaceus]